MSDDDIPAVAVLLESLAREHIIHEFEAHAQLVFLTQNNESSIRQFVAEGFRYHVAELDGRVIGFVGVRDNKHLYHLFVANEFQRQGLGRQLWNVARADCVAAGNPGSFTVNSSNNAVAIYEKLGFVRAAPTQNKDGVFYNPMAKNHAV
jgi:ribosomal protein S18 acetylase RimI-like enzyme